MLLSYKYKLPQIKGVFNFYGVTEVRIGEIDKITNGIWGYLHSRIFIRAVSKICYGIEAHVEDDCFEDLSPLKYVSPLSPPTITLHGWQDSLVNIDQAVALHQLLESNNVSHVPVFMQGNHDCDIFASAPCAQAVLYAILRFLASEETKT